MKHLVKFEVLFFDYRGGFKIVKVKTYRAARKELRNPWHHHENFQRHIGEVWAVRGKQRVIISKESFKNTILCPKYSEKINKLSIAFDVLLKIKERMRLSDSLKVYE
jgi:hypothetical protein